MGLKELSVRDLKINKRTIKALEFYGCSEEDIRHITKIKELEEENEALKKEIKTLKETFEKDIQDINTRIANLMTNLRSQEAEDFQKQLQATITEFTPYGK